MSDAEFELELVEALNMLLEDERASVEMEVALASGATEYGEREALAAMGAQDIHFCEQLREEMERAGLAVTPQINGIVFSVIGAERYDDRLRAFAHHQRAVAERARELQESNLEGALREALEGISASHDGDVQWSERRAGEFAATRLLEFGAPTRGVVAGDPADQPELVVAEEFEVGAPEALESIPAPEANHAEGLHPSAEQALDGAASTPVEVSVVEEPAAGVPEGASGKTESVEPAAYAEAQDVAAESAAKPKSRARAPRAASAAKAAAKPKTSRARSASSDASAPTRRTRRTSAAETTDER